jgi:hypothetical protein
MDITVERPQQPGVGDIIQLGIQKIYQLMMALGSMEICQV